MSYLLDTNVLIALAWPSHAHHDAAQRWFARKRKLGFRTCPITQTGFVRISCNPAFLPDAVTPQQALNLLELITSLPGHEFWPADLALKEAIPSKSSLTGHRQITDAYLLALAAARRGVLATLDKGVLTLAGADARNVELLR